MKITALVENTTKSALKPKHGLSLYIETARHKILFDLGPDNTLFENADKRNIDLSEIDTVIISHGHADHGGALGRFLTINKKARIFIQNEAFESHFTKTLFINVPIGLDEKLKSNRQIVLLDGDFEIDEELLLFKADRTDKCHSPMNDVLLNKNGRDTFSHEQNLIINENKKVLVMGCGHSGVVNIMEKAEKYNPDLCVGGFHLFNPVNKKTVSEKLLDEIAKELSKYGGTGFYTCHCTGKKAFDYLSGQMSNLHYLSCGDIIEA